MGKRRLEQITEDYWAVSHSLRDPHSHALTYEEALGRIGSSDLLRPDEWRLRELTHTLRYDLIEGSTKWRDNQRVRASASILRMRD